MMKNYQFTQFMKYSKLKGAVRGGEKDRGGLREAKQRLKPVTPQKDYRKMAERLERIFKLNQ